MPPEGASVGSQGPEGQWLSLPACGSEQVPELLGLHCWPLGLAAWLTLLPIVYSEGVIHKNSRTTILFPPLSLLLVLAAPSTLSSIKANELKALSAEGAQESGGAARKVGGRGRPGLEEHLLHLPGVSGSLAASSSVPVQPPSPAAPGVQAPPSLPPSLPPVKLHCRTKL